MTPQLRAPGRLPHPTAGVREALALYMDKLRHVRPSLSGRDLMALGVPQGPAVGAMLARLRICAVGRRRRGAIAGDRSWCAGGLKEECASRVAEESRTYHLPRAPPRNGPRRGGCGVQRKRFPAPLAMTGEGEGRPLALRQSSGRAGYSSPRGLRLPSAGASWKRYWLAYPAMSPQRSHDHSRTPL